MTKSRAGAALVAAILIAALVVRVAYVERTSYHAINDAGTYNRLASMVAETGDYDVGTKPGTGAGGSHGPTAYFPPGYPFFLAGVDIVDGHRSGGKTAVHGERIAMALLGTVTVGLVGLVALEAFGGAVALICMTLAAVYPVMIELSGMLVAENLLVALILAAIWAAMRARRSDRPYVWIAASGVFTGLATLTHQNAIVILIPLGFAAVAATRATAEPRGPAEHTVTIGSMGVQHREILRAGSRVRDDTAWVRDAGGVALLAVMAVLTILPWTIRNAVEMHHFIPVSDETGITLRGTYNPASASFTPLPYKWRFFWQIPEDQGLRHAAGHYSEPALGAQLESRAIDYIKANPLSPLDVAYHNTLRMFELAGTYAWHASAYAIDLHVTDAGIGVASFWLLCIFALCGVVTRSARAAPRWLWAVPVLLALTIVFINVETPRFREPIDPFLLMLAGCAVEAALEHLGLLRGSTPFWRRWRPALDT